MMETPNHAAVLILPCGRVHVVQPANGKHFNLAECQSHIGGYVELIRLPGGKIALVDEDANLKRLPPNGIASTVAHRSLVGPVMVGPASMLEGA